MTTFEELKVNKQVLDALKRMNFETPTPIQEQAIPLLMAGKDIIGQAQTGTGKTAAFGIPILQTVDPQKKQVQALILVPTRELAVQVTDELENIGYFSSLKMLTVYGGVSMENQVRMLREGVQVVIATPGRILDHISRNTIDLSQVRFLVLDEADRMLDMGFIDDVEQIMSRTPKNRLTALFSATMPGMILELSNRYMNKPVTVRVSEDEITVNSIKQYYLSVEPRRKIGLLLSFFQTHKPISTIIFCRTQRGTDSLAALLKANGISAIAMHGRLTQARREQVLDMFRTSQVGVLVATDLAARGLDINDVSHVVNFDMPQEPLVYIHRIGRTGRAGKTGDAVTFTTSLMEIKELRKVENMTGVPIERMELPEYQSRINPAKHEQDDYHLDSFNSKPRQFGRPGHQQNRGHSGNRPHFSSGSGPRPGGFRRGSSFRR